MAHRISCSVARGIFLDQGWSPHLLHWQADFFFFFFFTTEQPGKPLSSLLKTILLFLGSFIMHFFIHLFNNPKQSLIHSSLGWAPRKCNEMDSADLSIRA